MNDQNEVVYGIVLMRKYGNTLETLKGVEAKVHDLNTSGILPKGYKVVPYYDRTTLVETTLHTVLENLSIGMMLVFLVLIFFLGNLRAAINRRDQHPARAVRRVRADALDQHARQSDFAGRDRLRHHHRYHRHRDGKHRAPSDCARAIARKLSASNPGARRRKSAARCSSRR